LVYTIGISDNDVDISPTLHKHLASLIKKGHVELLDHGKNYVKIDLFSKEQLLPLSESLANLLMENLQINFISKRLMQDYSFLTKKDRKEVLIRTIKSLWSEKESLEKTLKEVGERIAVCLLESKDNTLNLNGVLFFRMKDKTEEWINELNRTIDAFLLENEKNEFVKLLRYYVCMRDPLIPFVKILPSKENYALIDDTNSDINVTISPDQQSFTKEDVLLTSLLALSPEVIDAAAVSDPKLVEILKQIFVGRLR
jgi:putative sporulation protein YtxC